MTKDEIKKALECCAKSYGDDVQCSDCPYNTLTPRACCERFCQDVLCKDALTLITEQENEIERLKEKSDEQSRKSGILGNETIVEFFDDAVSEPSADCKDIEKYEKQFRNRIISFNEKEVKQAQIDIINTQTDTINAIVKYCENPNHWLELKDCKLWGGKSDDLRNFLSGIFKEVENE
jgi:hypothetical protein